MHRKQHGAKIKDANFSILIIANLNSFVKTLIFLVIGKELQSENATVTPSLDHVKSLNTTQILFVSMKTMN